jgi:hypothetical protein
VCAQRKHGLFVKGMDINMLVRSRSQVVFKINHNLIVYSIRGTSMETCSMMVERFNLSTVCCKNYHLETLFSSSPRIDEIETEKHWYTGQGVLCQLKMHFVNKTVPIIHKTKRTDTIYK